MSLEQVLLSVLTGSLMSVINITVLDGDLSVDYISCGFVTVLCLMNIYL